jgi:hypothetical protein
MSKGNSIVVQDNPRGCFIEGIVSGTPIPGTVMEMVPATVPVNGRFTYRSSARGAGRDRMALILMEDSAQGGTMTGAYVSGTRCQMYVPLPGEDVNVLVDVPGTGTSLGGGPTIGEYLEYNNDGHLTLEVGSPQSTDFISDENIPDTAVGYTLTWVTKL